MSKELKIIANDDGTFSEYDDTFDIIIHCQSEEEQNEVLAKLNAPQPKMGQWIFDEVLDHHYYCSECKSMGVNYWDYCPYCGSYNGGDTNADSN